MTLPRLIGITGAAGAGKDTVAAELVQRFGYTRYSLADPIKELLNARFGWTMEMWNDREWKETPRVKYGTNREFAEKGLKGAFSPRSWAQWLGTEVGRNIGGEDVWIDRMADAWYDLPVRKQRMVVPDVRFDNEARRIRLLGGVILKVARETGEQAVQAHVSEQGLPGDLIGWTVTAPYPGTDILISRALAALEELSR